MKLINQSAVLLPQESTLAGVYKQIELAARTCYKSEDRITEDSAERMVNGLIKSGHLAMLEHGTVYLKFPFRISGIKYLFNPYSIYKLKGLTSYVTTNLRVIVEHNWYDDLKYIVAPTKFHEKRYSVRAITNLQVSHELVRHKVMSYAMESSRYCNYSKDKFDNELTFIKPLWLDLKNAQSRSIWMRNMERAEYDYLALLKEGWPPEEAAQVLPKATKTELVITATEKQWEYWFDLRYFAKTGKVHPQMKELASYIKDVLPIKIA